LAIATLWESFVYIVSPRNDVDISVAVLAIALQSKFLIRISPSQLINLFL
jgi:hypothetical protein